MTQDEIIEMARQAGLSLASDRPYDLHGLQSQLFEFAKLVAAKEREACIAIAESKRHAPNFTLTSMPPQNGTAVDISNAIRARGKA